MSVNSIDAEAVLARMRALASQARGVETQRPPADNAVDFGEVLKGALDAVNETQHTASAMRTSFERGETGVDLAEVMVAIQKANISFQAATQVRNRLVSAYQDIMNMPI
ncbi:MAG: flagellar hook-basal body complex protein FliE [Gammaproteobacteria bacterium]